jgi:hypothetical protein
MAIVNTDRPDEASNSSSSSVVWKISGHSSCHPCGLSLPQWLRIKEAANRSSFPSASRKSMVVHPQDINRLHLKTTRDGLLVKTRTTGYSDALAGSRRTATAGFWFWTRDWVPTGRPRLRLCRPGWRPGSSWKLDPRTRACRHGLVPRGADPRWVRLGPSRFTRCRALLDRGKEGM